MTAFSIADLIMVSFLGLFLVAGLAVFIVWRAVRRQARENGYRSTGEYLRAAPATDREKRQAVDLALKGLVICLLGGLFPPLLLIGLFPLFFGARKVAYATMGLGLIHDADQPGA
ncbi:MAG: hypothetical protein R2752_05675 [Vicinamibacterales bacterium]